jgi:hypothetical protein
VGRPIAIKNRILAQQNSIEDGILTDPIQHTLATLHNEAANKLDYFILGATLAICAYLAQTNTYGKLGVNAETFLLGTLLVFAASAILGFKRLEATIAITRMNALIFECSDPAQQDRLLIKLQDNRRPQRLYKARNYLLFAGLVCYLATKVWATY